MGKRVRTSRIALRLYWVITNLLSESGEGINFMLPFDLMVDMLEDHLESASGQ